LGRATAKQLARAVKKKKIAHPKGAHKKKKKKKRVAGKMEMETPPVKSLKGEVNVQGASLETQGLPKKNHKKKTILERYLRGTGAGTVKLCSDETTIRGKRCVPSIRVQEKKPAYWSPASGGVLEKNEKGNTRGG